MPQIAQILANAAIIYTCTSFPRQKYWKHSRAVYIPGDRSGTACETSVSSMHPDVIVGEMCAYTDEVSKYSSGGGLAIFLEKAKKITTYEGTKNNTTEMRRVPKLSDGSNICWKS